MSVLRVFAVPFLCGLLLCLPAVPQQTPPAQPHAQQPEQPLHQFRTQVTDVIVR